MSRLLTVLVIAAAAAVLSGCFFEPRTPEAPSTQAINYLPRSSAANVWENCRLALVNKDTGGWDTAVSADFRYEPDSETEGAYPTVDWTSWNKDAELNFINSWFATDVTINADLLDETFATPDGSGGLAEWDLIYLLTVTDNQSGSVTRYRGRCVLQFTLEGSYWYLSYWRDEGGEEDPDNPGATLETMGRLRGAFAP
jgi:hypothetical protein